ncbi:uncharacterized protein OCT59_004765 [Rhizophagus irregularis]|uniref:uncharacterized protein n=1 Tax=Rhizophagus irregularis TaxID=588596 RepID=UPI003320D5B2|nr:hypothetical protein OCT59_004765 [Rhizophagus irregularis]
MIRNRINSLHKKPFYLRHKFFTNTSSNVLNENEVNLNSNNLNINDHNLNEKDNDIGEANNININDNNDDNLNEDDSYNDFNDNDNNLNEDDSYNDFNDDDNNLNEDDSYNNFNNDDNDLNEDDSDDNFNDDDNNDNLNDNDFNDDDNDLNEDDNFEDDINTIISEAIVDEALKSDKLLQNDCEFGPYFESITATLLFCWIQKHSISTRAYDELVDILKHPQFRVSDIISNNRRFREWRRRLPLIPIRSHSIKISTKKTPSITPSIKPAYYLSISDIIWHILNNKSIFDRMYFGPAIETEEHSEFWHGEIWGESPCFGDNSIMIRQVKYQIGEYLCYNDNNRRKLGRLLAILYGNDGYKLKIQRILTYNELPTNFKSNSRSRSYEQGEFWLLDRNENNAVILIEPQDVIKRVNISQDPNADGHINEILYKHNNRWKLRSVSLEYKHPSEYAKLELTQNYEDALPQLEKGKIFKINGQDSLIIASIGQITADLPQGNDLTGVKRHIAVKGCRSCQATRDIFTNPNLDIAAISRYHHVTDTQFEEINLATTIRTAFANSTGCLSPNCWKNSKIIKYNYESSFTRREKKFLEIWKHFEYPKQWHKLPNPVGHHDSFMMSDCLRLAMMMPFILNRFLEPSCIKKLDLSTIQQRCNVNQGNAATKIIITCWKTIAETTAFIFKESFSKDDYMELQRCLETEMIILSQAFEEFSNLPNLHANFHLVKNAKTFATLINSSVGVKEIVHKIFKGMVPKMNRKNIELDLMK